MRDHVNIVEIECFRVIWLFGGDERNLAKMFLVIVPDRNEDTLINFVKREISSVQNIIYTSCKVYYKRRVL